VAACQPELGLFGNTFTFLAVAFERYIVAATREAMPRITDPTVVKEADGFLRQEAQHARAHRLHANAMIAQYPGLAETFAAANAAYDALLEGEDVEFHLAYIATWKRRSRHCSRWSSTIGDSCSRAATSGWARCSCGTSSRTIHTFDNTSGRGGSERKANSRVVASNFSAIPIIPGT